jgi:drug/metabolite transporter (DMT)-like permease
LPHVSNALGTSVLVVVLIAALLHATWNAIAHALPDRLAAFTLIGAVTAVGGLGVVILSPAPSSASWAFIGASAVLHVAYNLLLMRSYQLGEFGQMYPLARGTSPWLVALAAAVVAGETLSGTRLAGLLVVSAGLASLVFTGGLPRRANLPALGAAVATGVMIAAYTTVDGLGVRRADTVLGYTGWLFLLQGSALPVIAAMLHGRRLPGRLRPHLRAGLAGGVLSMLAYGLVLWAQTRGALAPIAALRETSVVIGAIIGAVLFHERFGPIRVVATLLVTAGVILINL